MNEKFGSRCFSRFISGTYGEVLLTIGILTVLVSAIFFSPTVAANVESIPNSNPPQGSLWVENSSLHWADGSTEYFTTVGEGILSAWDFSSNSGTAYDKYRDQNGSLQGGASMNSAAGYYGDGVSLGGSSLEGVDYGHLWDDHSQSRTFVFWFNESGSSSGDRIISQDCSEWFCITDDGSGSISVSVDSGSYSKSVSVKETGWNHIALSFDERTSTVRVFKNGKRIDTGSYSSSWSHGARPVVLGGNTEGYGDISGNHWEGSIDEFKMYHSPMNEKQINEIYLKGRDRFSPVVGNFHLDRAFPVLDFESSSPSSYKYSKGNGFSYDEKYTGDVYEGSYSSYASNGDGQCDLGGIARNYSFKEAPKEIRLEFDGKRSAEPWGETNLALVNSSGKYEIKRWAAGGSSYSTGWGHYSFNISNPGKSFGLVFGNYDTTQYCSNGDHGWTFKADNIEIILAKDSSGWGNHGEAVDPKLVTGKKAEALRFDGNDDDVTFDDDFIPAPTSGNDITYTAWVRPHGSWSQSNELLRVQDEWLIGTPGDGTGNIIVATWGNNYKSSLSLTANSWQHIAVVYDAGNSLTFYRNGSKVDSTSYGDTSGDSGNSPIFSASGSYDGELDEVKIYQSSLSQDRIKRLYNGSGTSPDGPKGSVWVEGKELHYIDQDGYERIPGSLDTGYDPSGASKGNAWLESNYLHFIDSNGNEKSFGRKWFEGLEDYADGTSIMNVVGWKAGSDCGTCEVDGARSESGSKSAYHNVGSTDNWQDVMIRNFDSQPLTGDVKVSFEYWESSSNHDGNLWVRACDGTNLAGIGTENPQFEWSTNTNSNTNNPGADYQDWTYAEMDIDLDAATVDFYWKQDNGGESWDVNGKSIPSGKKICTVGVGPDAVWNVDDISIKDY